MDCKMRTKNYFSTVMMSADDTKQFISLTDILLLKLSWLYKLSFCRCIQYLQSLICWMSLWTFKSFWNIKCLDGCFSLTFQIRFYFLINKTITQFLRLSTFIVIFKHLASAITYLRFSSCWKIVIAWILK